jgi:hypothetical protein
VTTDLRCTTLPAGGVVPVTSTTWRPTGIAGDADRCDGCTSLTATSTPARQRRLAAVVIPRPVTDGTVTEPDDDDPPHADTTTTRLAAAVIVPAHVRLLGDPTMPIPSRDVIASA